MQLKQKATKFSQNKTKQEVSSIWPTNTINWLELMPDAVGECNGSISHVHVKKHKKTRNLKSHIDMHTHTDSILHNHVILTLTFSPQSTCVSSFLLLAQVISFTAQMPDIHTDTHSQRSSYPHQPPPALVTMFCLVYHHRVFFEEECKS